MTASQLTRGWLHLRRPARRPAAITALQLGFLAWAAVELALGRPSHAVALVATFAVLQAPRLMRLPVLFDVAPWQRGRCRSSGRSQASGRASRGGTRSCTARSPRCWRRLA